jgi:hypothetical protein
MPDRGIPPIEPFVERTELGGSGAGARAYRFGYRLEGTKDVLSVIDIPAKTVELALTDGLSLTVKMTPTGDVSPILNGRNEIEIAPSAVWAATTIERLVTQALSSENLRLEEAGSADLSVLQQRLERATSLVKGAIERLNDPSKAIS